ncbi:MAG: aspartate kinase [Desulfomicrobium apsheronum]|nr:aspartate kinase [Desulfomicrobium apsheronum]
MALVVQKYGGSSVATPDKIRDLARRIVARHESGDKVVVVVSAMGKSTDALVGQARELAQNPDPREMDMLVSAGERISIAMMSIAINGIRPGLAVSFTGSQIGLITDCNHGDARVLEIKGDRLREALDQGRVVVVAGFQGVSTAREITTLGRGGSDTTAVAVAAALSADVCEIYSDVDGVYTSDPRLAPSARRLDTVDYETMLEMSAAGAKVLKDDAVEYARRLGVRIAAGSSSSGLIGTIVSNGNLNRDTLQAMVYHDRLRWIACEAGVPLPPDCRLCQSVEGLRVVIVDEKNAGALEGVPCVSLSLIGSRVAAQRDRISAVLARLEESGNRVLAISSTATKYEIFLEDAVPQPVVAAIHDMLFA